MQRSVIFLIMIVFSLSLALSGCTQNGKLKDEVQKLKESQENTAKDLEEIKKLLQAKSPQPPQREEFKEALIDVDTDPFEGEKLAKVTLIEFYDFQ